MMIMFTHTHIACRMQSIAELESDGFSSSNTHTHTHTSDKWFPSRSNPLIYYKIDDCGRLNGVRVEHIQPGGVLYVQNHKTHYSLIENEKHEAKIKVFLMAHILPHYTASCVRSFSKR